MPGFIAVVNDQEVAIADTAKAAFDLALSLGYGQDQITIRNAPERRV